MKTQSQFKVLVSIMLLSAFQFLSAQNFQLKSMPDEPGERKAISVVKLKGIPVSKVSVSIVYGTNSLEVKNAFDLRKSNPSMFYERKATLKDLKNDRVEATIIFPHLGLEPINRERVFSYGTKVFFAWARTHVPNGASEELTINSNVSSSVMPRRITIAYMADSYASGQGAKGTGRWADEACHRSNTSGGVLAINK